MKGNLKNNGYLTPRSVFEGSVQVHFELYNSRDCNVPTYCIPDQPPHGPQSPYMCLPLCIRRQKEGLLDYVLVCIPRLSGGLYMFADASHYNDDMARPKTTQKAQEE